MKHTAWTGRSASRYAGQLGGQERGHRDSFALDSPGVEEKDIKVFTTRPDTAYGVTFMVLAPEHPLVAKLTTPDRRLAVDEYIHRRAPRRKSRGSPPEKEKDGALHRAYVTNRLNCERVPIWIADYVLLSYGTGRSWACRPTTSAISPSLKSTACPLKR